MKLEDLMDTLGAADIKNLAVEKTDELTKGAKKFIKNIKQLDKNLVEHPVLDAIKDNFNVALDRVNDLEVLEFAKGKVVNTRNQVLSVLNVPTQVEMDNLTRKMASIEKKLKTISKSTGKKG